MPRRALRAAALGTGRYQQRSTPVGELNRAQHEPCQALLASPRGPARSRPQCAARSSSTHGPGANGSVWPRACGTRRICQSGVPRGRSRRPGCRGRVSQRRARFMRASLGTRRRTYLTRSIFALSRVLKLDNVDGVNLTRACAPRPRHRRSYVSTVNAQSAPGTEPSTRHPLHASTTHLGCVLDPVPNRAGRRPRCQPRPRPRHGANGRAHGECVHWFAGGGGGGGVCATCNASMPRVPGVGPSITNESQPSGSALAMAVASDVRYARPTLTRHWT